MKILKPVGLDLENLIQDDRKYTWHKNHQGKLGLTSDFVKGKIIRKNIPKMYYFISTLIIAYQDDYNRCLVSGFDDYVKVHFGTLDDAGINRKKLKQIILFLKNYKIIDFTTDSRMTNVPNQNYYVNTKYYNLLEPYDDKYEIYDIDLEFKKTKMNKKLKIIFNEQPCLRHQYDRQKEMLFDFNSAEKQVNTAFYGNLVDMIQFISYYNMFKRIYNKNFYFVVSDKCNRVFTVINNMPKFLRKYIVDKNNVPMKELDFSNFNVMLLYKIFKEYIDNKEVSDKVKAEFNRYTSDIKDDFYLKVVEYYDRGGYNISREVAKEIVLIHWINAKQDSYNRDFKIMKKLFPELTKIMIKLKGDSRGSYLNFYNNIMKRESELVNKIIYSRIMNELPSAVVYTIFDGLIVEDEYTSQIQKIMLEEGEKYIGHEMKVGIK